MRSTLARLDFNHKDKEEQIAIDSWCSGGKGDGLAPQVNGVRYFSIGEIRMYTDDFSERNRIVIGGMVYRGCLPNGVTVAIRRVYVSGESGIKEFKNEIELLSRVHHKNIVSLVGFCFGQGEQALVYEYMSKGSLASHLHGIKSKRLNWRHRLKIALDVARGLAYLHELVNPHIILTHTNTSNILLDEHLNAKITDFCYSKSIRDKKEVYVDTVEGTLGYMSPEYLEHGQLSEKNDVYSFGVVMLELLTAKSPRSLCYEVRTAIDRYDQGYFGLRDMIDPEIVDQARNNGLGKFVQLALACVEESASDRPSMREVMKGIEIVLQDR